MSKLKKGQIIQIENLKTEEVKKVTVVRRLTADKVIVETSDGKQETIDLLNFVVTVIPLLDIIISWISEKISRLFKR